MIARGPHLPLGCDAEVLTRFADDLSAELGIAVAPVIPFGVHSRRDPDAPGSASLTRKTLHRLLNELIAAWETEAKVRDVFILTTHAADAHLEALSTIRSAGRVTLIDIYAAAVPDDLRDLPADTLLLEAVAPELIDRSQGPPGGAPEGAASRLYAAILASAAERIRRMIDEDRPGG